jgi:hypothetical protein
MYAKESVGVQTPQRVNLTEEVTWGIWKTRG